MHSGMRWLTAIKPVLKAGYVATAKNEPVLQAGYVGQDDLTVPWYLTVHYWSHCAPAVAVSLLLLEIPVIHEYARD